MVVLVLALIAIVTAAQWALIALVVVALGAGTTLRHALTPPPRLAVQWTGEAAAGVAAFRLAAALPSCMHRGAISDFTDGRADAARDPRGDSEGGD